MGGKGGDGGGREGRIKKIRFADLCDKITQGLFKTRAILSLFVLLCVVCSHHPTLSFMSCCL